MPLRILHISGGNLYGGVETVLATLVREEKVQPNIQNHFALCFEGRLSQELRAMEAPLTILGAVRARYPWTVWGARRKLMKLLRASESPFDAIICHMPWNLAIFGPVVKRYRKCPLIFWLHDVLTRSNWVERWARLTIPDVIICNSEFTASTVSSVFPSTPYWVLYYPISDQNLNLGLTARAELRASLETSQESSVIIQVSRMEPYKGHKLHLEALSRVKGNWICWMVGGAQRPHEKVYFDELQALAKKLGIAGQLRFLGDRRDVHQLLAAADLFCQPNIRGEPFGIVFIEALYAGLPIISTDMGGAREIIDDTCGRLVSPGDVEGLSIVLQRLVDGAENRRALGSAGPERARTLCNPGVAIEKLQKIVFEARSSRTH